MSVSLHHSSTLRQPIVRPIPLGELLTESWKGHQQLGLLLEAKHNGEDVEKELATLHAHLDAIEAEIKAHPHSAWRRLEAIEALRLGR